jgi:CRP/FNR family transcriptional regulator, cyclic AMP receptor protein
MPVRKLSTGQRHQPVVVHSVRQVCSSPTTGAAQINPSDVNGISFVVFRDTCDTAHRRWGHQNEPAHSLVWPASCSDEYVAACDSRNADALTFIGQLPPVVADAVASLGREQPFKAQEIVSHQGSPPDSVFLITSGIVKVTALSLSGREVILGFRAAGELLGEYSALHGSPRSGNVVGHEAGALLRISAQRFRQCAFAHPEIFAAMLTVSGQRLHQSDIHRVSYAAHDVPYRTAATLLDWATRYGVDTQDGVRIRLRVSRRELAQVIAASEKSVDDVLTTLRRSGLVTTGRRLLVVSDIERLRHWLRERPDQ